VGSFGEGSSFDGRSYNGRADEMNVRDRWRHYRDDASFRAIFAADPRARAIVRGVFRLQSAEVRPDSRSGLDKPGQCCDLQRYPETESGW